MKHVTEARRHIEIPGNKKERKKNILPHSYLNLMLIVFLSVMKFYQVIFDRENYYLYDQGFLFLYIFGQLVYYRFVYFYFSMMILIYYWGYKSLYFIKYQYFNHPCLNLPPLFFFLFCTLEISIYPR